MSEMNRRHLLFSGIGALALGGVGAMVMARSSRAAGGWEHRFLPVSEMTADGALLVDIRTPKEWQDTGVIEGAELIEFDFNNPNTFLPKIAAEIANGRDLVLICNSGNRTQVVADFLSRQIPNRIISVEGGIQKVLAAGYQTVPPS
ncbi:MAG: rhodanese-like domain-containing protein [Maritimibacter sp.]|nr:rhodanese-like domain-containing protein [Maritimibacter sp.]